MGCCYNCGFENCRQPRIGRFRDLRLAVCLLIPTIQSLRSCHGGVFTLVIACRRFAPPLQLVMKTSERQKNTDLQLKEQQIKQINRIGTDLYPHALTRVLSFCPSSTQFCLSVFHQHKFCPAPHRRGSCLSVPYQLSFVFLSFINTSFVLPLIDAGHVFLSLINSVLSFCLSSTQVLSCLSSMRVFFQVICSNFLSSAGCLPSEHARPPRFNNHPYRKMQPIAPKLNLKQSFPKKAFRVIIVTLTIISTNHDNNFKTILPLRT